MKKGGEEMLKSLEQEFNGSGDKRTSRERMNAYRDANFGILINSTMIGKLLQETEIEKMDVPFHTPPSPTDDTPAKEEEEDAPTPADDTPTANEMPLVGPIATMDSNNIKELEATKAMNTDCEIAQKFEEKFEDTVWDQDGSDGTPNMVQQLFLKKKRRDAATKKN